MTQITMTKNSLKDFDIDELDALEMQYYKAYRVTGESKEKALQNIIDMCLGRYNILSEGLAEIAREYTQD